MMKCPNCQTDIDNRGDCPWGCSQEPPAKEKADDRLALTACSPSSGGQEPEQEKCGTTHYAGCACHEQGWENKWKAAIEMAARATVERDELLAAIRAYRDAKGRYHTQLVCERLLTFLPENDEL